jgi:hypothetical protein
MSLYGKEVIVAVIGTSLDFFLLLVSFLDDFRIVLFDDLGE